MTIDLTPELEAYVRQAIASGAFADEAEVLAEAVRLLRLREERRAELAELRRLVQVGLDQADRGEVGPIDAQATLERIRARRLQAESSTDRRALQAV